MATCLTRSYGRVQYFSQWPSPVYNAGKSVYDVLTAIDPGLQKCSMTNECTGANHDLLGVQLNWQKINILWSSIMEVRTAVFLPSHQWSSFCVSSSGFSQWACFFSYTGSIGGCVGGEQRINSLLLLFLAWLLYSSHECPGHLMRASNNPCSACHQRTPGWIALQAVRAELLHCTSKSIH